MVVVGLKREKRKKMVHDGGDKERIKNMEFLARFDKILTGFQLLMGFQCVAAGTLTYDVTFTIIIFNSFGYELSEPTYKLTHLTLLQVS